MRFNVVIVLIYIPKDILLEQTTAGGVDGTVFVSIGVAGSCDVLAKFAQSSPSTAGCSLSSPNAFHSCDVVACVPLSNTVNSSNCSSSLAIVAITMRSIESCGCV